MVSIVNLGWLESESQAISFEEVQQMLRALSPTNDAQRAVQSRIMQLSNDLAQTRLLLVAQKGSAIPMPFLAVLVWWLAVILEPWACSPRATGLHDHFRLRLGSLERDLSDPRAGPAIRRAAQDLRRSSAHRDHPASPIGPIATVGIFTTAGESTD
jgi:hypothetical protein